MSDVFGSPENYRVQIYLSCMFVFSVIGCLASILTLLIIREMKPLTSHVYLIFYMTLFQLFYNAAFFFKDGTTTFYVKIVATFIVLLSGIATSFVSNWIAFAMYSTVLFRQKFDVYVYSRTIHLSYLIPSTAIALIYLASVLPRSHPHPHLTDVLIQYVYNFTRFGSIGANFFFVFATSVRVYNLYGKSGHRSTTDIAISTLCQRMIWYPIIQSIGRIGSSWYELEYGIKYDPTHPTDERYAAMLTMVIIAPAVSVGYLAVFLWMQPNAWQYLRKTFGLSMNLNSDVASKAPLSEVSTKNSERGVSIGTEEGSIIRGNYASHLNDSILESELLFSRINSAFDHVEYNNSSILLTETRTSQTPGPRSHSEISSPTPSSSDANLSHTINPILSP